MKSDTNGARAEEKRNRQLDELRAACPLLTIEATFAPKPEGWTLRGLRGGETIVLARSVSLVGAALKLRNAYGTLATAGGFKRFLTGVK